jgi:hypothetical protein
MIKITRYQLDRKANGYNMQLQRNTQAACLERIRKIRRRRNRLQTAHGWHSCLTFTAQRNSGLQLYSIKPSTQIFGTTIGEV